MKLIYDVDFTFHITCIICLVIGGWILKKTCKKYPQELIPVLLVLISVVVTAIHFNKFQEIHQWNIRLMDGLTHGLAAVGVHQVFKQTTRFFRLKRLKKNLKNDKRKRDRLVS